MPGSSGDGSVPMAHADAGADRFRRLYELHADAILLVEDGTGRILDANASAERLYGYTSAELSHEQATDLTASASEAGDLWRLHPGLSREMPRTRFQKKKDGTVFPADVTEHAFVDRGRTFHFAVIRDISERWTAARAHQESDERFRTILEHAPDAVIVQVDGRIAYVNPTAVSLLAARSALDLLGLDMLDRSHPDYRERVRERIRLTNHERRAVPPLEQLYVRLDGTTVAVEVSATPITYLNKPGSLVFARDITRRKQLESELAQSQRLESIGQVAGGIAHDFNNMLNVIGGYTEMALTRLRLDDPLRPQLLEVKQAADRAAELTTQLLAFSRRQASAPQLVDLNTHIMNSEGMMRRILGESVTLKLELGVGPAMVRVDAVQLDQVLVNLLSNAKDALPGAGSVHVETHVVSLGSEGNLARAGCTPGAYVEIAVTDNGCGMSPETRERVFEPFFTTKPGAAGLGLAVVYGVIKQHNGCVQVSSTAGRGATFKVYLPRQEAVRLPGLPEAKTRAASTFGHEVVLVVEDEAQVRRLVVTALERYGYSVLQAASPEEALDLARGTVDDIHLLLTDVIMPGMDGAELQRQLSRQRPGIRTLFMSGYASNVMGDHGILETGVYFIQKPFSVVDLTRKVRQLLDARP
jgi:two-component system, cell cycle sensor histidine kinase and response regulator CckA